MRFFGSSMKDYRQEYEQNIQNLGNTVQACDYQSEAGFYRLRTNILNWLGNIQGKNVLDAGSGWGLFSQSLTGKNRVFGLDFSFGMAKAAAQNGMISFNADTCRIPLKDHTMDIILSIGVVQHLNGCDTLIKELARVVKPGGTVIICTLNKSSLVRSINRLIAAMLHPGRKSPMRYESRDLADAFTACGLSDIETMSVYYPFAAKKITKGVPGLLHRLLSTSFAIKAK